MKRRSIIICAAAFLLILGGAASAQVILPGNVPLPPPPPPPKIEVPVVPKVDELPQRNYVPPPRPSFGDRVTTCLEQAAAAGLGPSDRAAYSRACASR
jgi:hypothetical protein